MDGLDCKEVTLKDTLNNRDFRIDSAFYTTKLFRNPDISYEPIGKYLVETQYGVSKDMNTEQIGYPIYRMNEIHHMLCDVDTQKYVELSKQDFSKVKLNDGDVLFNRTNSYELVGRTGVYYSSGKSQTFASYLVRLVPDNKKLLSEYLAAFLSSKYGIADIKRRSRQSINQTNVNPEEVKEILIPMLNEALQVSIKSCFSKADKLRKRAQLIFYEASEILRVKFGLDKFKASRKSVSIKSLRTSFGATGRIDAEYYQPKYSEYKSMISGKSTVGSLCKLYDGNYMPNRKKKYQYIELANIGMFGNIADAEVSDGFELPSRARRKVRSGQIIVSSIEGSLENCAFVTDEYDKAICSTGFYVLDSEFINSETLLILFKSELMQALMKQRCSGTILTAINKDEFLSMPLPEIDDTIQKQIAEKVQESFALRLQADNLLGAAKRAVEMAIEQNEDVALRTLNEFVQSL